MLKFLGYLLTVMPRPCPRLLLSTTLVQEDVDECAGIFHGVRPNVLHGPLDRRGIGFKLVVSGSASTTLKTAARRDFAKSPHAQHIWYTHSRTKAETSMRATADTLLEENRQNNGGPNAVSHPFVGTDGVMMKAPTMIAIKNYDTLEGEGTILNDNSYKSIIDRSSTFSSTSSQTSSDEVVRLPKIQCILATKSAEAVINGKFLQFGKINGFPASFYELVQQLGRVD